MGVFGHAEKSKDDNEWLKTNPKIIFSAKQQAGIAQKIVYI